MPEEHHGLGHRVHTACDVRQYSTRDHATRMFVQTQLEGLLDRAAQRARVTVDPALVQHRGDGYLTLWPTSVTTVDILTRYLPAVHEELVLSNEMLTARDTIQLRFAVSSGTSEKSPSGGFIGTAVITVARLVDSAEARRELAAAGTAPLVVFVDDHVYQDVVGPGLADLDPDRYRRVDLDLPEKRFTRTAWLTVPGAPLPPARPSRRRTARLAAIGSAAIVTAATLTAAVFLAQEGSPAPSAASHRHPEIAGNHKGVRTFADPDGTVSTVGAIPFGTTVDVSCVAPNQSGMGSINAFYRVETEPWRGTYAPANTFTNGDELGTAGTHDLDPAVPPC